MYYRQRFCSVVPFTPFYRSEHDPVVQNGLAITPQDALEMAISGIPIGTINLNDLTYEQRRDVDMSVPPERCRGWDMADGFQAQMDLRQKVGKVKKGVKEGTVVTIKENGEQSV